MIMIPFDKLTFALRPLIISAVAELITKHSDPDFGITEDAINSVLSEHLNGELLGTLKRHVIARLEAVGVDVLEGEGETC